MEFGAPAMLGAAWPPMLPMIAPMPPPAVPPKMPPNSCWKAADSAMRPSELRRFFRNVVELLAALDGSKDAVNEGGLECLANLLQRGHLLGAAFLGGGILLACDLMVADLARLLLDLPDAFLR